MRGQWQALWERDSVRLSVLLVILVAFASSVTGLGNQFAFDDIGAIVENPMVTSLHAPWEYLTNSYWGPEQGNRLYRPLTVAAYGLQWAVGGGRPWVFHLANVVLYVLSSLAVLALLRVLLTQGAALAATLAWAAHPVHVEAVANVVGQSELLTAIPVLVAVTAYSRDRVAGALRIRTVALIAVCFAVALLSKEHGILLPALVLLVEGVFRGRRFASDVDGRAPVWLLTRVLVIGVVAYLVVRFAVLDGFAGDLPHPSLEGLPMGRRLWVMLALVPEFVRLFWWPVALYADYSPQLVSVLPSPGVGHLVGSGWLVITVTGVAYGWRRDRLVACALLWVVLTLGPISNILVATGVLLAERTLFLPSVGIALLAGRGIEVGWPRLVAFPKRWVRAALSALAGIALVAAIALSAQRQLVWVDNPTLFATSIVDAPHSFRFHYGLGQMFLARSAWKPAAAHLRTADSLLPGNDIIQFTLAVVLHHDNQCAEALRRYDRVLAMHPSDDGASIGRTACLLESQRLLEAREEALRGRGRGQSPLQFSRLLQLAESSLVATDTVDARNRWFRSGRLVSKPGAPLRVPVLTPRPRATGVPLQNASTRGEFRR